MADPRVSRKWLWLALVGAAVIGLAGVAAVLLVGSPSQERDDAVGKPEAPSAVASATTSTAVPETLTLAAASVPRGGIVTMDAGEKTGTFELRIFLWNDTAKRALKDPVVKWGTSGSWTIDSSMAAQTATIGPFRTGRTLKLTVYPDGESGKGSVVPFVITPAMLSGSERDGVHVEIRDDGVRVLGNAVENFERPYSRP